MTRIYENFIKVLQHNGSIFNLDDVIKWGKYTMYNFSDFSFRNMAPIPYIWHITYTKRDVANILMSRGEKIEETEI